MILIGELNAQMRDPCDKREEDLATALVDRGLVNMTEKFMPDNITGGQADGHSACSGKGSR